MKNLLSRKLSLVEAVSVVLWVLAIPGALMAIDMAASLSALADMRGVHVKRSVAYAGAATVAIAPVAAGIAGWMLAGRVGRRFGRSIGQLAGIVGIVLIGMGVAYIGGKLVMVGVGRL